VSEARSRLFHAIVGLGVAASGCGKVLPSILVGEAGEERGPVDAGRDHFVALRDAGVDAPENVDAGYDAGRDAGIDARRARDAAHDVFVPPPPPPVK
jgi:hypothetical protein